MATVGLGKVTFSWWFRLVVIVTFLFFCVEKSNELTTRTKYVNNNVSH